MAAILVPGYLKWDGLKWVLDDVQGSQGEPGPAGAPGADGGGDDGYGAIIFDGGDPQNMRANRTTDPSNFDNTKNGMLNLGSDVTGEGGTFSDYAIILGGDTNLVNADGHYGSILNGQLNTINGGSFNTILNGLNNTFITGTEGYPEYSLIYGQDNSITGSGDDEVASRWNSILGGEQNTIDGAFSSTIIGGRFNTINDNVESGFIMSHQSSINGDYAIVAGGTLNSADGNKSAVLGGDHNYANADHSIIIGGSDNDILLTADSAVAMGESANPIRPCQVAHAIGNVLSVGEAQNSTYMVKGISIEAAPTILVDISSTEFNLENGKAYAIKATCLMNRIDGGGGATAMFIKDLLAHCTAGAAVIDSTTSTLSVANGTSWVIAYTVTSNKIRATLTGTAGQNVYALVKYEFLELGRGV